MADQRQKSDQTQTQSKATKDQEKRMQATENEPAVERGERIATGKAIARAGRSSGVVPGAQASSEKKS